MPLICPVFDALAPVTVTLIRQVDEHCDTVSTVQFQFSYKFSLWDLLYASTPRVVNISVRSTPDYAQ